MWGYVQVAATSLGEAAASATSQGSTPPVWGYVASILAVLFFGSNFVPVKKFETGDGMFFQWVLCCAIWISGLIIHLIVLGHYDKPFYPLAMLGGFLWATGNVAVVPIIKTIGLGQGILIWGSFNLMAGWVSGRFGLFGLKPEVPGNTTLNYIGLSLCMLSAICYIFIKTESQTKAGGTVTDEDPLLAPTTEINDSEEPLPITEPEQSFLERLSPTARRLIGTGLAMVSGVLYGVNFAPVIWLMDNMEAASQNGLDYVFAHFCGIFLTSTAYFIIYCAYTRNKPKVFPSAILPAFASGIMWAIADAAWFVANATLSEAVSFPIIATGPGVIGALWGVFFGEIRGLRNILIMCLAFAITITGGVLTGLSK